MLIPGINFAPIVLDSTSMIALHFIYYYILLKYGARRNSGVHGVVVVRHATFVALKGQKMTRPSTESEPEM
jgi:hypothetical protein